MELGAWSGRASLPQVVTPWWPPTAAGSFGSGTAVPSESLIMTQTGRSVSLWI